MIELHVVGNEVCTVPKLIVYQSRGETIMVSKGEHNIYSNELVIYMTMKNGRRYANVTRYGLLFQHSCQLRCQVLQTCAKSERENVYTYSDTKESLL